VVARILAADDNGAMSTNLHTDPALWTTTEQVRAIANRELSSVELLHAQLARIEKLDPLINAVCTPAFESAKQEAKRADETTMRGEQLGMLHGIPVTIKDAITTAGIRSTGGGIELRDYVPTEDAPAVAAIKREGAFVIGKTNLPRWSGEWQAFNEMFGTTNNPWDLTRTPGGSSGGATAAVATGMSSFEIGTDIGGSVRLPSAFSGVYGHKPSFGIIPTLGYLDEPNGGLVESDVNVFGPIARSAKDLRLLLDVLAQPTPERAAAWRLELPEPSVRDLQGCRIGVWFEDSSLPSDPAQLLVFHEMVAALENVGAHIDHVRRPAFRKDAATAWIEAMQLIGAACSVSDGDRMISHTDWLFADRERAKIRAIWADYFRNVDVLLCPVSVTPAIPHLQHGDVSDRVMQVGDQTVPYYLIGAWASLIGAAYLPSTSTPIGRTASGLPVGVQVVAPYLHDRTAIAVSGWITELVGGYVTPPMAVLS
jgi:amidase